MKRVMWCPLRELVQKSLTNGRIMLLHSHTAKSGNKLLGCKKRNMEAYLQEARDVTKDGRVLSKIAIQMAAIQKHKKLAF
jgi:hypothetical protein